MPTAPNAPRPADAARNNSASVRRALAILLHLADDDRAPDASVAELAGDLGLNKSTTHRLLAPLLDAHLVERSARTGRYRLGAGAARVGAAYLERLDVRRAARDHLLALARDTGETVHLVVADLPDVVYVDKVDSPQALRMFSRIGGRAPAYCTAVGKALLAQLGDTALRAVTDVGLAPRTENTLVSAAALREDLERVRRRGYAIDDVENEPGVRCVAAAVFDHTGTAAGAISVSGPASRISLLRARALGPDVVRAADAISRAWGAAER